MNSKINEISMSIILHAGDAQFLIHEALDAILDKNYTSAYEKLNEARIKITQGHSVQTEVIQNAATEEEVMEYSLLFSHAQDTLMTVKMSLELVQKMMLIFERFDSDIEGRKSETNNN